MCLIQEFTIKLIILGDFTPARPVKSERIRLQIIVEVTMICKDSRGTEKSPNKPKTKPRVKTAQLTVYSGANQGTEN